MGKLSSARKKRNALLSITALGVVYGDIGTSPLYAFRESLQGVEIVTSNILGVMSLIFWTLILVISIKYLCYVLRADNEGEGGVLALLALLKHYSSQSYNIILLLAILGAGLLFGDGMLTPAISVMSAVEGISVISPKMADWVVPITLCLLSVVFYSQRFGTNKIGFFFGPIIILWFFTMAVLGISYIIQYPAVLKAVNPYYAVNFFITNGWVGYKLLGSIFLVVTGGEALYADLGHFGKTPIRMGWFTVALPCLVLNYFGQAACVLLHPESITNPFYSLAPEWFSIPLVVLATFATIIASQAVISATFSMINQAILLELCPRLAVRQTSRKIKGQIYIPQINIILAIGSALLVIGFGSSSELTHAYGIAVNLVMITVTILLIRIAEHHWHWSKLKIFFVFSIFISIDAAFLGANLEKIATGGWVPLLMAATAGTVMLTWKSGMEYLHSAYYIDKIDLSNIVQELNDPNIKYITDYSMVFITDPYDRSGGALLHYLKLNRIIPENILLVSTVIANKPYIIHSDRCEFNKIAPGIYRINLHFGFMEVINLPKELESIIPTLPDYVKDQIEISNATFLVEMTNILVTNKPGVFYFTGQKKLFEFLMRVSVMDIEFLKLPYNRTIAIGSYCEV